MFSAFATDGVTNSNNPVRPSLRDSLKVRDDTNGFDNITSILYYEEKISLMHPWREFDDSVFYTPGEQLQVCCNVVVLNLGDISTTELSYRMRLELWAAWPLTRCELRDYIDNPDTFKPIIHPEPIPWTMTIESNDKMIFLSGRTIQVFMWRGKVMACECSLVTARYIESMELDNFPLDCQHFNFHIGIRCDTDMPLRIINDKIQYNTLEFINGFTNFDGRAMVSLELNPKGCTFNVRTKLLSLEEFVLKSIECEIENTEFDIPFFHCSLRLARNYFAYIFRIFIPLFSIMLNSTFALRFEPGLIDSRLGYTVTNLLTVVAFLFVINLLLPAIPYLTMLDRYMSFSLTYVLSIAILCLLFDYYELEGSSIESGFFVFGISLLIAIHLWLGVYFIFKRKRETRKLKMDRHQVDEFTSKLRKIDEEEYLVHTEIHKADNRNCYEGTLRSKIYPKIAAGWLSEVLGQIVEAADEDDAAAKSLQFQMKI